MLDQVAIIICFRYSAINISIGFSRIYFVVKYSKKRLRRDHPRQGSGRYSLLPENQLTANKQQDSSRKWKDFRFKPPRDRVKCGGLVWELELGGGMILNTKDELAYQILASYEA